MYQNQDQTQKRNVSSNIRILIQREFHFFLKLHNTVFFISLFKIIVPMNLLIRISEYYNLKKMSQMIQFLCFCDYLCYCRLMMRSMIDEKKTIIGFFFWGGYSLFRICQHTYGKFYKCCSSKK